MADTIPTAKDKYLTDTKSKWPILIITGIISLTVGIGSGVLVNYLTEKAPRLTYDVTSVQSFPGQTQKVGIVAIRISNPGKREVENLLCRITLVGSVIIESRASLSTATIVKPMPDRADVSLAFLNPSESMDIQLLVQPLVSSLQKPEIELRGKGVLGQEAPAEGKRSKSQSILTILTAVLTALSVGIVFINRFMRRREAEMKSTLEHALGGQSGHSDDQRDILAYVLSTSGFREEAKAIRASARERSYWSLCDELTDTWLETGDAVVIGRGIEALKHLLDYSIIASRSTRIINLNIARLALANKNQDLAMAQVALARESSDPVIEKRIALDRSLSILKTEKVS